MPDHTNVRHDSTKRYPDECPAKCPVCKGTGFHNGKICICITGEHIASKRAVSILKN